MVDYRRSLIASMCVRNHLNKFNIASHAEQHKHTMHIDIAVCMRAVNDRHRDIAVCMRAVSDSHAHVAGGDSVFNEPLMFCLKKLDC